MNGLWQRRVWGSLSALGVLVLASAAQAREPAVDATRLVQAAVAHIRAHDAAQAYVDITAGTGPLAAPGLYLVVYGLDGRCLAHGAHAAQVGRNLSDLRDIDGRYPVRERVELAQAWPAGFWHETRVASASNRRVEQRLLYCERLADTAICAGPLR